MRPIFWAALDKRRPALLLTPVEKLKVVSEVTVAPISGSTPGLRTQLVVGIGEGLSTPSSIRCESITIIRREFLLGQIGALNSDRELELRAAIVRAFRLPTIYDDDED